MNQFQIYLCNESKILLLIVKYSNTISQQCELSRDSLLKILFLEKKVNFTIICDNFCFVRENGTYVSQTEEFLAQNELEYYE